MYSPTGQRCQYVLFSYTPPDHTFILLAYFLNTWASDQWFRRIGDWWVNSKNFNLKLASWSTVMLLSNADFTLITSTFLPHPAKFLEYKTVFLLIFESPQLNSRSGCHTRNLGGWTCPGVIRVVSSQKMCIGVGTDTWRVDWECTSKMWQLGSAHSSQERRFPAGNQEGEWDWKDK
jgi:hypothetical protein